MSNIPIRQHYIPQFILRNFLFENNKLRFYNKEKDIIEMVEPRDIFMENNLYTDSTPSPKDPYLIENLFSKYENEIAKILKPFLTERHITLSKEENDSLLFMALLPFRSSDTKDKFIQFDKTTKKSYLKDSSFSIEEFLKFNLSKLLECRSFLEVKNHPEIYDKIKIFMYRDTLGSSLNDYFVLIETKEDSKFIISEFYPTVLFTSYGSNVQFINQLYYPISLKRCLLKVSTLSPDYQYKYQDAFSWEILARPKKGNNTITYSCKRIYPEQVESINKIIIDTSKKGYITP